VRLGVRLALPVVVLLGALDARAQQYGQWSWDASLGAGQRRYDNFLADSRVGRYGEVNGLLALGLNGFIVHPNIAQFRLGLDTTITRFDGTTATNNSQVGFRGDLRLFPRGKTSLDIYFGRQGWGYADLPPGVTASTMSLPDTVTSWGARLRLRSGTLVGLLFGVDHSDLSFVNSGSAGQSQDRQFLDWSRSGKRLRQHYALERRAWDYGSVTLRTEDTTLNADEFADLGRNWLWTGTLSGAHRSFAPTGSDRSYLETASLRNRTVKTLNDTSSIQLSYDLGGSRGSGLAASQTHALSARYVVSLSKNWQVSPALNYGYQRFSDTTVRAPGGGLGLSWSAGRGTTSVSLSGASTFTDVRLSSPTEDRSDRAAGSTFAFSLRLGSDRILRAELEGSAGRNQLRRAGNVLGDVPRGSADLSEAGTENTSRVRLTLRRSLGAWQLTASTDWDRHEASGMFARQSMSYTARTASLTINAPGLVLQGNAGDTRFDEPAEFRLRFASGNISFRPWRSVSVRGSYRSDLRNLGLGPDLDTARGEAGLDFHIGQFVLAAQAFQTQERTGTGVQRTDRGVVWSFSRRFGGWLPFVSGVQRRGVVR